MRKLHTETWQSPFGALKLVATDDGLRKLYLPEARTKAAQRKRAGYDKEVSSSPGDHPVLKEARRQLEAYFSGNLFEFDLPLLIEEGTDYQRAVWKELRAIPYGSTISYAELAKRAGRPAAVRGAGSACGRNPLPIVVPCHRVISSSGGLGGYGGGLEMKENLLALEQRSM